MCRRSFHLRLWLLKLSLPGHNSRMHLSVCCCCTTEPGMMQEALSKGLLRVRCMFATDAVICMPNT
jgi:hypothetical protein